MISLRPLNGLTTTNVVNKWSWTIKFKSNRDIFWLWVCLHCDIIIPKSNIYFGQFLYISQTLCIWGCPTLTVVSINLCVTSESSYRIFETLQCLRLAECWDPFLTLPQLFNWSQYFPIRQFAIGNKQPTGRSWLALCHLCLAIGAANQVS